MGFFSVGHFFSVCSPTSPRSFTKLPDISSRGSFLKVKVIEVKGQISVSRQSLVRFAWNLVSVYRLIPD